MFKRVIFAVSGALFLTLLVLSIDAQAIPFEGEAWVAHHIGENGPTGDYYLVFDPMDIEIDLKSVKMGKKKLKRSTDVLDFRDLTQDKTILEKILWFDIDKKDFDKIKKFDFEFEDSSKGKKNKTKYKGTAKFANFNNPVSESNTVPVPEPATLLLVGSGLIGLAAFRRKKIKKA